MKVDLHIRKLDEGSFKRLELYGYDIIFVDEKIFEPSGSLKVKERRGLAVDASKAIKPKPILHTSIHNFESAATLVKKYPNRVRCVEVDLKELRNVNDKIEALKNIKSFSKWLSRRNIPLFFASGAEDLEELVPPFVLNGFMELIEKNFMKKIRYKRFFRFLEEEYYG